MRDIKTINSEPRLVVALRRAAHERGGPLPSIDVADPLLDETTDGQGGVEPREDPGGRSWQDAATMPWSATTCHTP